MPIFPVQSRMHYCNDIVNVFALVSSKCLMQNSNLVLHCAVRENRIVEAPKKCAASHAVYIID